MKVYTSGLSDESFLAMCNELEKKTGRFPSGIIVGMRCAKFLGEILASYSASTMYFSGFRVVVVPGFPRDDWMVFNSRGCCSSLTHTHGGVDHESNNRDKG